MTIDNKELPTFNVKKKNILLIAYLTYAYFIIAPLVIGMLSENPNSLLLILGGAFAVFSSFVMEYFRKMQLSPIDIRVVDKLNENGIFVKKSDIDFKDFYKMTEEELHTKYDNETVELGKETQQLIAVRTRIESLFKIINILINTLKFMGVFVVMFSVINWI
jgi:hypothetical protein